MTNYRLVYPSGHGGNFLKELISLSSEFISVEINKLDKYLSRYLSDDENWVTNEEMNDDWMRSAFTTRLTRDHIYNPIQWQNSIIVAADAFASLQGKSWADNSAWLLSSKSKFEDADYCRFKSSTLPNLRIDMTKFLLQKFDDEYYADLCELLHITPNLHDARTLHAAWWDRRVGPLLECAPLSDHSIEIMSDYFDKAQLVDAESQRIVNRQKHKERIVSAYNAVKGTDWPDINSNFDNLSNLPDNVSKEFEGFEPKFRLLPNVPHNFSYLAKIRGFPIIGYYCATHIILNLDYISKHELTKDNYERTN